MSGTNEQKADTVSAAALAIGALVFAALLGDALSKLLTALEPYSKQIEAAASNYPRAKRLEGAGWLPHSTFPYDLLDQFEGDDVALNEAVVKFYADEWLFVRAAFEDQLGGRAVDDNAKKLFQQALTAHEMALYRLVPRAIFPELERLSRMKLGEGPLATVTSQKQLRKLVGERLDLESVSPGGIFGLTLFDKFFDHVFKHVEHASLQSVGNDPVPNRHAVLHGFCDYATAQSSINSLILADYVFHLYGMLESAAILPPCQEEAAQPDARPILKP